MNEAAKDHRQMSVKELKEELACKQAEKRSLIARMQAQLMDESVSDLQKRDIQRRLNALLLRKEQTLRDLELANGGI